MLKSLRIQNFQSHEDSLLEFDPGVNVIIGQSDSGKTAILRALRWLLTNRPGGDAFRSNWGGNTIVNLAVEKERIQRIKTAKENMYVLNDQELKAIGMDVPDEIKLLLNMDNINVQEQLDRPFLLDNSPGEVAQHFNQIARLDVIDIGRKNIEKWSRQIESDIRYKESEKNRLEDNLKKYWYLPKLETDVEVIEGLEGHQKQIIQKIGKLNQWLSSYEQIQTKLKEYLKILSVEGLVNMILDLHQEKKIQKHNKTVLQELIDTYEKIQNVLYDNNEIIKSEKQVDQLLALYSEKAEYEDHKISLVKLMEQIQKNKEKSKKLELLTLEKQQDFDYYMPNICPLCNQKIK